MVLKWPRKLLGTVVPGKLARSRVNVQGGAWASTTGEQCQEEPSAQPVALRSLQELCQLARKGFVHSGRLNKSLLEPSPCINSIR